MKVSVCKFITFIAMMLISRTYLRSTDNELAPVTADAKTRGLQHSIINIYVLNQF